MLEKALRSWQVEQSQLLGEKGEPAFIVKGTGFGAGAMIVGASTVGFTRGSEYPHCGDCGRGVETTSTSSSGCLRYSSVLVASLVGFDIQDSSAYSCILESKASSAGYRMASIVAVELGADMGREEKELPALFTLVPEGFTQNAGFMAFEDWLVARMLSVRGALDTR